MGYSQQWHQKWRHWEVHRKENLCILNDSGNPASATDLSICTPVPALRCTLTREVIPVSGYSQRLIKRNLQSHVWTKSQAKSFRIKTPSPPLFDTSSLLQKVASVWRSQSPKSVILGSMKSVGICPGQENPQRKWGHRHSCHSGKLKHRLYNYLTRKKRIMDKICLNYQHQHPNQARVEQWGEYLVNYQPT